MAKLEGVTPAGRQAHEKSFQAGRFRVQARRQLEKNRPQFIAQSLGPRDEIRRFDPGVGQPLDMGDGTVGLDGENEIRRRAFPPALESLPLGEAIKRSVDLDGRQARGIILQPALPGRSRREENLPPVVVLPSRRADEHVTRQGCASVSKSSQATARISL
ncbi:MAG: hypothetical protein M1457_04685, partial [bacterium]|nr:hypothetical protein [bacterium]